MIEYETNPSSFFTDNKNYVESIVQQLDELDATYSGYCNSYGYDVEATFDKNLFSYRLQFIKAQVTRNGVYIPKNAHNHLETRFVVTGLYAGPNFSLGKSYLRRLFMPQRFLSKIPKPFFLKMAVSDETLINRLIQLILDFEPSRLKRKDEKLSGRLHIPLKDVHGFVKLLESISK
jgi:hypothetical protein